MVIHKCWGAHHTCLKLRTVGSSTKDVKRGVNLFWFLAYPIEYTPIGGRRCGCGVGANWLAIVSLAICRLPLGLGTGGLKICHLLMTRHVPGTVFWSCASSSKEYFALPKNGWKHYLQYTFLPFPILGILDLGTSLQMTHPTHAAILLHHRPPSCLLAHGLGHERGRRSLWRAWHTFVTANYA